MNIYITGIAGLVGSNLARLLSRRKHVVRGCDNLVGGYEDNIPEDIKWSRVDICNTESMQEELKNIDTIIHTAA